MVMAVVGSVLLIASALKTHQLLTEPIISKGFWESREFFIIQIPLEIGLGIWVLCGLFRKAAWLTAVLGFAVFVAVTLYKALIGAESCGCFGVVKVNPWITFSSIDVPLLAAMLIFRPKEEKLLPPPWPSARHFFGVAIPTCILLVCLVFVLVYNKPPDRTQRYEVVRPEQWTKQAAAQKDPNHGENILPWDMLRYIDIAGSLKAGIVVVIFYSNQCDTCHEAVPVYDRMSRDMSSEGAIRFAFIEIPPYADKQKTLIPDDTPSLVGRLDSSRDWYIKTPLVVLLRDGIVVKSWEAMIPGLNEIMAAAAGG